VRIVSERKVVNIDVAAFIARITREHEEEIDEANAESGGAA